MRRSIVLSLLAFALESRAGEEPSRPVLSTIDVEIHGRLKADASYDDSRAESGNYVLYVNQEHAGRDTTNDDEFNLTANETRLWLIMKGPEIEGFKTGGKVEFDFYGANAAENKAKLMLRRAYIEAGWPDYGIGILAGQDSDVISPLVAYTLNYTVGWDLGNIGYRRPQIRLTKTTDIGSFGIDVAGAVTRTIGGQPISNVPRSDYGEDSGFPTLQGRLGFRLPGIGSKQIAAGFSGHWGEEQVDDGSFRRDIETYSFNVDAKVPIALSEKLGPFGLDLELSGELFYGSNLDDYYGGIGQGVSIARRKGIVANGGWGQLSYLGLKDWRFVVGGGADDPHNSHVHPAGRRFNRFLFANAVYSVTRQLQVGLEYGNYETDYQGPDGTDNRVQFSMLYNF